MLSTFFISSGADHLQIGPGGVSFHRVGRLPGYILGRFGRSLAAWQTSSRHLLKAIVRFGIAAILVTFLIPSSEGQEQKSEAAAEIASGELLFKEGQALAAEWTESSLRRAIEKFQAARAYWQSKKDFHNEVRALNAAGEIFISLSEYRKALDIYTETLSLSRDLPERVHSLNGVSLVYEYLGDQKKALSYAKRALRISLEAKDLERQAESLEQVGEAYYFLGETQKALETLEQALSVWPDKNWTIRWRTLLNIGYVHFDLRNMEKALTSYEEALSQSRNDQNRRGEALALTAIGGVYSYLGNRQTAIEHHNQAVTLFRTIGDRNGEGVALNGLGYVYRNLGEHQKSLDCYLRAMELFRVLGNSEYETFTITRVGKAYEGLGNNEKALDYYRLALNRTSAYSQSKAQALNSIGTVLESMHKSDEALTYYKQSLALFRAVGDRMGEASILNSLGKIYSTSGKTSEAVQSYQRALAISRAVKDRRGENSVLFNLAKAERDAGNHDEARHTIEDSLNIIESMRTEVASTNLRASYFASVRQHYELYIDILMQLHKRYPEGRFAEDAFAASEKARARSLLESLGEARAVIRQGVDRELIEQERDLQQRLNEKAERQMQAIARNQTNEADSLSKEIDQLAIQYDEIEAQIRLKNPRFAALTQPQPLTLKTIQEQVLDDNSLLLEYTLGDDRSYLWAVTRSEVLSFELPGRVEIESVARKVYDLLIANQPLPAESSEQRQVRVAKANEQLQSEITALSSLLLTPVMSRLTTQRLLIVADGALQYIPFQILTKADNPNLSHSEMNGKASGLHRLVEQHVIINEPSASALALLLSDRRDRKPPPNTVAVLADPVFESDDPRINAGGLVNTANAPPSQTDQTEVQRASRDVGLPNGGKIPRLWASGDEADAIMSAVSWRSSGFKATGFEASRTTAMRADLGDYGIVHFATHGFLNDQHPELSGIVLSLYDQKGQPQDGFLRLHDIYNLKLPVDLVVLSACSTGLGKDVKGEGLIGLTRGFMYAGAGSVVASLWKVDDEATAQLMGYFYRFMLKDGLSPAAALRQAQIKISQQPRWQSPYYWAGFVIQGQYDHTVKAEGFATRRVVLGASLVVAIGGFGFLIALKRKRRRFL